MSLYLDGIVDPIAAMNGRELDVIPRHFHCVSLSNRFYDLRPIRNWIWKNQSGRFCLTNKIKVQDRIMMNESIAAFEDSGEAVMFSFILPTLKSDLDGDIY